MNREQVMSVLYDLTMVIGGELRLKPLLTRTLQRLLYHTSFPTALAFLDLPADGDADTVEARLEAAVGDFELGERTGHTLALPAALLRGPAALVDDCAALAALPRSREPYRVCLRLPVGEHGVILLLAPQQPHTELPLTQIFQPVLANLDKAILLCRHHESFIAGLTGERDRARAALGESEERFRLLSNAAPDAIVMIDDADRVAYWNPAAERLFGFTAEEAAGREAHALIVPERYLDAFRAGFARFRATGQGPILGATREVQARRKDGVEFPAELSVSALRLRERWHAIGIVRDISARKAAEAALACSEASLREAQHIAQLGSWELDLRTDTLHWSEEIYRIFEIDPRRFGASYGAFLALVHPEDRELVDQAYADSLRDRSPYDIVHRLLMPDGRVKYVNERCETFYDAAGQALRSAGTVQDVTERRLGDLALRRALLGTIQAVALTVEKRDPYTAGHQRKVGQLAAAIARELGWADERIEGLRLGAAIHDIGKIYVPAEILNRPGALQEAEFALIRSHPQVGYEILRDIEFPWPVAQMILQHHERLDGSGYPQGLADGQIIEEARILAVADVVESMASHRPYRPAKGLDAAFAELEAKRGSQYEAAAVDACLRLFRERGFRFD